MFGLQQLSSGQRLSKAVVAILRKQETNGKPRYAALASLLMLGKREVVDWCPTAGTDGCNEFYGDTFTQGLSDSDLRGLVLHECKHKAWKHPTHGSKSAFAKMHCTTPETKQLANVAMDYVINLEIVDENPDGFATLPKGGMFDEKFRGMDWMEVFLDIKENGVPKPNGGTGDGGGEGTGDDGTGDGGTGDGGAPTTVDSHDWEDTLELDDAKKAEVGKQIDEAIRQGVMAARKLGSDDRSLADLVKPQVDWRRLLREFVSTTCSGNDISTYRRPNKRLAYTGVYHPSSYSESVGELVILGDTSYSTCNPRTWSTMLTELVHICETTNPERVRILYWGSEVVGDEVYERDEIHKIAHSTKPRDGGGTDVRCVNKYMADKSIKATAIINITDGYLGGDWGTWDAPLLWCILDNTRAQPPVGKVVHIQTKQM